MIDPAMVYAYLGLPATVCLLGWAMTKQHERRLAASAALRSAEVLRAAGEATGASDDATDAHLEFLRQRANTLDGAIVEFSTSALRKAVVSLMEPDKAPVSVTEASHLSQKAYLDALAAGPKPAIIETLPPRKIEQSSTTKAE
jgi:hypothetical protein